MTLRTLHILEIRVHLKTAHCVTVVQELGCKCREHCIQIMMCSTLFSSVAKLHTFWCFSSGFLLCVVLEGHVALWSKGNMVDIVTSLLVG
jgi:hypothetical protein